MIAHDRLRLLLCGGLLLGGLSATNGEAAAGQKKKAGPFTLPGMTVLAQVVHVAPTVGGRVTAVSFRPGDRVKAGQVLAELDATRARLEVDLSRSKVDLARARHQAVRAGLTEKDRRQSPGKDRLAVAAAEVKCAEAELRLATHRFAGTQIRAPIAGTIVVRNVQVGDVVGTQATRTIAGPLFELADLRRLEVRTDVAEGDIARVFRGQNCRIEIPAIAKSVFRGTVTRISPVADPRNRATRVYVAIELPERESRIRSGMFSRVTFLPQE